MSPLRLFVLLLVMCLTSVVIGGALLVLLVKGIR